MPKKTVWLSYDLSYDKSYDDLFTWLDGLDAKECGNSIATFSFEYQGVDFLETLKKTLKASVKPSGSDRYYVIYRDETSKKMRGKFLFGGRKKSPWAGYRQLAEDVEDFAAEEV